MFEALGLEGGCMKREKILFSKEDIINTVTLNITLQIFYGFIPALTIISIYNDPHEALKKIGEIIPGWNDYRTYLFLFFPIITALFFYWCVIAKNFYQKYLVGCNLEPIIDYMSELKTIRYVAYNFSIDLIKTVRKLYLIYFGIFLFFSCALLNMEMYRFSLFIFVLWIIYNFFLNYIELRTVKVMKEMSNQPLPPL